MASRVRFVVGPSFIALQSGVSTPQLAYYAPCQSSANAMLPTRDPLRNTPFSAGKQ